MIFEQFSMPYVRGRDIEKVGALYGRDIKNWGLLGVHLCKMMHCCTVIGNTRITLRLTLTWFKHILMPENFGNNIPHNNHGILHFLKWKFEKIILILQYVIICYVMRYLIWYVMRYQTTKHRFLQNEIGGWGN